jgi:hypothetical protein
MTATLIPFPPRLVDLQLFSERECSDFLFHPDPHTLGDTAAVPAYQEGQRVAQKAAYDICAVDRGRCEAGLHKPFNAPQAATNSDRPFLLPGALTAGESVSPPALSSATYSPWRTRRGVYWS